MDEPARSTMTTSRTALRIGTALFVVAVVIIAVVALPRGFDTDLSRIGAGKPTLVFVYDPNLMVSNQQTREMDALRDSLGDAVHLLIADVGRPEAQEFMRRYQATRTELLLFSSDGRLAGRLQALVTAEALLQAIEGVGAR